MTTAATIAIATSGSARRLELTIDRAVVLLIVRSLADTVGPLRYNRGPIGAAQALAPIRFPIERIWNPRTGPRTSGPARRAMIMPLERDKEDSQ